MPQVWRGHGSVKLYGARGQGWGKRGLSTTAELYARDFLSSNLGFLTWASSVALL